MLLEHAAQRGPRDLALLTTLYDTGARVQEVCDLSIRDLHLGKPASATLTGKGRKTRTVPLTPQAAQILTQHVRTLPDDLSGPVFANRPANGSGEPVSPTTRHLRTRRARRAARPGAREDLPPRAASLEGDAPAGERINLIYIRDILGTRPSSPPRSTPRPTQR